jgi:hypothetical protein
MYSNRWRNQKIVVSSGTASSACGPESLNHRCMKHTRKTRSRAIGCRPLPTFG